MAISVVLSDYRVASNNHALPFYVKVVGYSIDLKVVAKSGNSNLHLSLPAVKNAIA
ncbi:hypothetical protein [Cylindrospermum sp. FACHB-282]|uniref:hypothetical protein n=1 Tax=Cylindrospermum sp. FACHB-282 TaxID=2692794 RepID=UPI00168A1256|nr:hypothetical protein [Cylindrospermum sp. FACHB-282]MBD2386330.1 hypothetical protein [Cylindrospermum sp. FACHB-282]